MCHQSPTGECARQFERKASEPFPKSAGITTIVNAIPDESDLIRRAQQGDAEALNRLVLLQANGLFRCAFTLCRDRQRAEDLVQETFLEVWKCLGRFDGRCKFSTWLFGILRNRLWKLIRKRSPAVAADDEQELWQQLPSDAPSPPRLAEEAEEAAELRRVLIALPQEHRLVVELRFFAGSSLEEIAAVLDVPLGTVKSRLHHGLEKLRRLLSPGSYCV